MVAQFEKRKYVLCEDGFENVIENGNAVGYRLKLRIPEYRGLPLAMVGGIKIFMDGQEEPADEITITSEGQTFRLDEVSTVTSIYWLFEEPIIVTIRNGKGLSKGKHKVGGYACVRISYMPAEFYSGEEKELEIA